MDEIKSDALVFLGATGDLAYKKIFPALQSMVKRGSLDVPVIGVAKAGWNLDQLKLRAKDSLEKHGGLDPEAFAKLCNLLRLCRSRHLSAVARGAWHFAASRALPGDPAPAIRARDTTPGNLRLRSRSARHYREAIR